MSADFDRYLREESSPVSTVCYACDPPNDWGTKKALKEHREKCHPESRER